jgi:LysR family transcriptional regulator for metE and metH
MADARAGEFSCQWPQVEMDFKSGVTFDPQPALQQDELDLVMTSDILPRSGCTIADV